MEESTLELGFLKGRFYGQVCVFLKKNFNNLIFDGCLHTFKVQALITVIIYICIILSCFSPLAIWLLPRDNHYGQWPRSGEIDLMETKGRDNVLVIGLLLVLLQKKKLLSESF